MIRNSKKIWPMETSIGAVAAPPPSWNAIFAVASLMALGTVPLEPVYHASFGYAEGKPIPHVVLQRDVELCSQLFLLFGYSLSAIELDLEGELSHEGLMLPA